MLGSGEKTVAPIIVLPSRSFCFAVLKIRTAGFCCCTCASAGAMQHKSVAQDIAIQIVTSGAYRFVIGLLLGRFLWRKRRPRTGGMILLRRVACVSPRQTVHKSV